MTSIKDFLRVAQSEEYSTVAENPSAAPQISVVVTSFNQREMLRDCLEALFAQDLMPDAYEVIVLDNGSEDETASMLSQIVNKARCGIRAIRLEQNVGRARARNLGVHLALGRLVAITDADCVPTESWLRTFIESMGGDIGIMQGQTNASPGDNPKLFSHYIVTDHFDGSFSTSNICYRREAIIEAGGFDPYCDYWEDTDLGWRVRNLGWEAEFAPGALVYHQVIPLSAAEWLRWPLHFRSMPAKAARHPGFRSHLFLGLWVNRYHALFSLALLGLIAGIVLNPVFVLFTLPYLFAFFKQHKLRGRLPPLKAAFHIAWDGMSFLTLLVSSVRHRALVL